MKVGVLGSAHNWHVKDLQRAASSIESVQSVELLSFSRLLSKLSADRTRIAAGDRWLDEFDTVLVRAMPAGSLEQVIFRMDALALHDAGGGIVVNPPKSLEIAIDKFLALARLQQFGFKVPETFICQNEFDIELAWEQLGDDELVLKPIFGGEGRGIRRVHRNDRSLLAESAQNGSVFYLQRFIPHDHDCRLMVIGDEILGMQRANALDWRTNVSLGATCERLAVTDELCEMAVRAAKCVGASICAVDFLPAADGQFYVLEVNAVPGWRALSETTGQDVARIVLEFLKTLYQSGDE